MVKYLRLNSDLVILLGRMTVRGTEGVKSLIRPNIAINQSPFKVNQGKGEGGEEKKSLEDSISHRLSIQEETPSMRPEIGLGKHIPIR